MPQTDGYYDICLNILYVMSTVIQYKHDQSPKPSVSLVGSDAKNALPTRITAMDMVGLTWIFQDEESCLKSLTLK